MRKAWILILVALSLPIASALDSLGVGDQVCFGNGFCFTIATNPVYFDTLVDDGNSIVFTGLTNMTVFNQTDNQLLSQRSSSLTLQAPPHNVSLLFYTNPPQFFNRTEIPTFPQTYSKSNDNFEINFTAGDNPISSVNFSTNVTGFSSVNVSTIQNGKYVYNFTNGVPAGDWRFDWSAWDSVGTTNTTGSISFTVNKNNSALALTFNPSSSVAENTPVTVSCSIINPLTKTLFRDGVTVADPYSATLGFGTYNFTCLSSDIQNYTPNTVQQNMVVGTSGAGCTNTTTFAFSKSISTSTVNTLLNFTSLVESSLVRPTLQDVYINANNYTIQRNQSGDNYYLVVNGTSFTVMFGNYMSNNSYSNASVTIENVSDMNGYSEINPYYVLSFLEESNGNQQLPPSANNTLRVFCSQGITQFGVNHSKILVATQVQPDFLRAVVSYSPTSTYFRDLLVRSNVEYKNFYLVDANLRSVVEMIVNLNDFTGDFGGSIFKVKKYFSGVLETMTENHFDAENKIIIYPINGDRYQVYVDNGNEERSIGNFYIDSADLTKTISINSNLRMNTTLGNITYGFGRIGNDTIYFNYYDFVGETNNVSMYTYFWNDTLVNFQSSANRSIVSFTFNTTSFGINETYKVRITIAHDTFGNATGEIWSIFGPPLSAIIDLMSRIPVIFPSAVVTGISVVAIMGLPMLFGGLNASTGLLITILFAALLSSWKWINISMLVLVAAFVLVVIMKLREGERRSR